ncbi:hypothetical protein [Ekhidna sp.]|uniref:hypothetical protein n=1 Tax=Ekhidna sp. TaxID=2608089 RepID=UPI003BA88863
MSEQTLTSPLSINVKSIVQNLTPGTDQSPTLVPPGMNYYIPIGTIQADQNDQVKINCEDSSGSTEIIAVRLEWESGDHIGVSKASKKGSIFTIDASTVGEESFYAVFSFNSNGSNVYFKIDPELKVQQGGG